MTTVDRADKIADYAVYKGYAHERNLAAAIRAYGDARVEAEREAIWIAALDVYDRRGSTGDIMRAIRARGTAPAQEDVA
jgi:hypothetical protein